MKTSQNGHSSPKEVGRHRRNTAADVVAPPKSAWARHAVAMTGVVVAAAGFTMLGTGTASADPVPDTPPAQVAPAPAAPAPDIPAYVPPSALGQSAGPGTQTSLVEEMGLSGEAAPPAAPAPPNPNTIQVRGTIATWWGGTAVLTLDPDNNMGAFGLGGVLTTRPKAEIGVARGPSVPQEGLSISAEAGNQDRTVGGTINPDGTVSTYTERTYPYGPARASTKYTDNDTGITPSQQLKLDFTPPTPADALPSAKGVAEYNLRFPFTPGMQLLFNDLTGRPDTPAQAEMRREAEARNALVPPGLEGYGTPYMFVPGTATPVEVDNAPPPDAAVVAPPAETPVDTTPPAETPVDTTPPAETPLDTTPPADAATVPAPDAVAPDVPADTAPLDTTPADVAPVQPPADTPVDTTPADVAPVDTTPADVAPVDTTPADVAPVAPAPEAAPAAPAPEAAPAAPAPEVAPAAPAPEVAPAAPALEVAPAAPAPEVAPAVSAPEVAPAVPAPAGPVNNGPEPVANPLPTINTTPAPDPLGNTNNDGNPSNDFGGTTNNGNPSDDFGQSDLGNIDTGSDDLGGSDLGGSDLGGSDLGGSDLGGSDLGGADLGGSDLSGSDLGGGDIGGGGDFGGGSGGGEGGGGGGGE